MTIINLICRLIDKLEQNFPNPFNRETKIAYRLHKPAQVKLVVFNLIGERIATLLNDELLVGSHAVKFNASQLTSGIYLYRIDTKNFQKTRRMLLIK